MMNNYVIIIVVIIILLLFLFLWVDKYIYGFWVAPEDFCEQAGISSMSIYLTPLKKNVLVWLLIHQHDGSIYNQIYEAQLSSRPFCYKLKFNQNDDLPFYHCQKIKIYKKKGLLTMTHGKDVQFVGYKNHEISTKLNIE
jgi:hypothetical protein